MNTFAKIDPEAFFRFAAEHPEQRYELERGVIVQQMTGGTRKHGVVGRRIAQQIEAQIDQSRWTLLQDRGVAVGTSARYPDIVVEPADEPGESLSTRRPALIVEVLSPSTSATDMNTKPAEYLSIPTLDAYIVASQNDAAMLVWLRDKKGKFAKAGRVVEGIDQKIVVTSRDFTVTLELAEIYKGFD